MRKYKPLYAHLSNLKRNEWHATFGEVERVLGFALPKSARSYPAWWSNGSRMPQSLAWLKAGWWTSDLNLTGGTVWFHREEIRRGRGATAERTPKQKPIQDGNERTERESVPKHGHRGETLRPTRPAEQVVQCDLRFAWVSIGEVGMDSHSKLTFPDVSRRPGLYRFTLLRSGDTLAYIGQTDNLQRRFYHYRSPGPSQATNVRLNKIFSKKLEEKHQIFIDIMVDTAWIFIRGIERPADFSNKAERVLLEHAAIVRAGSEGVKLLNR